ncbi:MAG: NAD(+)/NADH kinase [Bacteroidetes bacterium]|nr:NAD(+)/NADH kinase [Bacteroidota bacterium]
MNTFALFTNTQKPSAMYWAEKAAELLKELNVNCCADDEVVDAFNPTTAEYVERIPIEDFGKFADVVISFGGDGTMLAAAQQLIDRDIPLMGVNVGKLGFLAEFSTTELKEAITALINGDYRVVDRTVLETTIDNKKIYALNEFVIDKYHSTGMITVRASVDDFLIADYRADGLILTTPTGSTAYSLSSGGPIIAPSAAVLCITPISPHTLTLRPLVIPDSLEVTFEVLSLNNGAMLLADGQIRHSISNGEKLVVKRSDNVLKLVKHKDTTYFDLLRAKLLWSADATETNR